MAKTENNRKKELAEYKNAYRNRLQKPESYQHLPSDIKRAAEVMHQNLFQPKLTVGWLREQCRLNGNSFSARFKYHMGQYPKNYILHHRIEMAKILLINTNATLSTVSIALGFARYSTFCKSFKRHTGQIPNIWSNKTKRAK